MSNLLKKQNDEDYMRLAIKHAEIAYREGEVPVGAVAVYKNEIIARAYNQVEQLKDATAHAEMILLTQVAAAVGDWRLNEVIIYVTKEPCAMCAGAMVNSRLGSLIFGIHDKKYGAAGGALDIAGFPGNLHKVKVKGGVLEDECLSLFQDFFRKLR